MSPGRTSQGRRHRVAGECRRHRKGPSTAAHLSSNINTDQSRREQGVLVGCTQVVTTRYCRRREPLTGFGHTG